MQSSSQHLSSFYSCFRLRTVPKDKGSRKEGNADDKGKAKYALPTHNAIFPLVEIDMSGIQIRIRNTLVLNRGNGLSI